MKLVSEGPLHLPLVTVKRPESCQTHSTHAMATVEAGVSLWNGVLGPQVGHPRTCLARRCRLSAAARTGAGLGPVVLGGEMWEQAGRWLCPLSRPHLPQLPRPVSWASVDRPECPRDSASTKWPRLALAAPFCPRGSEARGSEPRCANITRHISCGTFAHWDSSLPPQLLWVIVRVSQ